MDRSVGEFQRENGHPPPNFDRVWGKLLAGGGQELGRLDAVSREIAVQAAGSGIPVLAAVAHQHPPAAAAENQGRAQTRRPPAGDVDVVD